MELQRTLRRGALAVTAALVAGACGEATGPAGTTALSLNFRVAGTSAVPAPQFASLAQRVAGPPLEIPGSNGSLRIDEILVIINEVELKPADGSCDSVVTSDPSDDCPEFEAPPRFLDLPLDGQPIDAVTVQVPAGAYKELDFEIEDLEDDETDPLEAAAIDLVRAEVLAAVPDWPDKASALITGAFTPTGGSPVDFRVFIDAEIEIEMELVPQLVVAEDGTSSRSVTVDVSPEIWFKQPSGDVLDLSAYDYDTTQQLLEFEVEFEDGFTEIEIDD